MLQVVAWALFLLDYKDVENYWVVNFKIGLTVIIIGENYLTQLI